MPVSKQVADIITWARTLIAIGLPILGIIYGAESLSWAVILLIINWTADSLDGILARRSPIRHKSWIGDHDLEIDMFISVGALAYLVSAGFLGWQIALAYLFVWLIIFWRFGVPHVMGVFFQLPVYVVFIIIAVREIPMTAVWMVAWVMEPRIKWDRSPPSSSSIEM
jgi:phosphatidylserine synthase